MRSVIGFLLGVFEGPDLRVVSDHCPVILESCPFKWGPTSFRFENMWLENRSFKEFFRDWWENGRVHGWEAFKFMRKLRGVKDNLKVWRYRCGESGFSSGY